LSSNLNGIVVPDIPFIVKEEMEIAESGIFIRLLSEESIEKLSFEYKSIHS